MLRHLPRNKKETIPSIEGKKEQKRRLQKLYAHSSWLKSRFAEILALFNASGYLGILHELLEKQFYRLANHLTAGQEINYRRFFNINHLIAIHTEKKRVFETYHQLVFEWLKEGKVQGLRIDHPDGLYDPTSYFEMICKQHPTVLIVEKILDYQEHLPTNWKVQGTVGYEFLNLLNGLFIEKKNEQKMTDCYETFIGMSIDFEALLYERKKWYILMHMKSELNALGEKLDRISESNPFYRDFTRGDLIRVLEEILACFPVYRTYIRADEEISNFDKDVIIRAVQRAKLKGIEVDPSVFDYVKSLLLRELPHPPSVWTDLIDFTLRFQQQMAPVMAKGLEDSCFYIYNRFLSLNEVGGNPSLFGMALHQFHHYNHEKLKRWPLGFLPTSTHDTKRSHDVRMRMNVVSEMPEKMEPGCLTLEKL